MLKRLIYKGVLISLLSSGLTPAWAASTAPAANSGQALEISPTVQELSVDPGKTLTETIQIHNISHSNQVVSAEVDDFTPSGESGFPKIDLNSDGTGPYSLKHWASLPGKVTIVPRQIVALKVNFSVPLSATPGSHYGILRFTATPPTVQGTGVAISTSVGVLEVLRVSGQVKESLKVVEFSMNKKGKNGPVTGTFFEDTPFNFTERLSNNGNADEQPSGMITVKDWLGHKVAYVPINQPPHIILPQSIRRFDETLDSQTLGTRHLFGRYSANLALTYGKNKQALSGVIYFWVIPYRLITAVVILLVLLVLFLRWFLKRFQISRK